MVPTVQIANLMELTGAGAKAGVSFHNGVQLAVKEINAAGGLLGRRIETKTYDTQSKPAVAEPFCVRKPTVTAWPGAPFRTSVITAFVTFSFTAYAVGDRPTLVSLSRMEMTAVGCAPRNVPAEGLASPSRMARMVVHTSTSRMPN